MGEIRIPSVGGTTNWSPYMAQKFEAIVRDWVNRVESGNVGVWFNTNEPISTEHLRIAKRFLKPVPVD